MQNALVFQDWIMVAGYFAIVFGIVWWVVKKNKDNADDYFLAGRNLGWFVIGASIFASNIGSEHLVGLAGSGATDGVAMAHYELHAWCLLVLAWVLIPFYSRSLVYTMPEFLERRFSPSARWVLSVISLAAYVVTKVAVAIFAGGVVFRTLFPTLQFMGLDSFWVGSVLVVVFTGLYTMLGGLRAVAYTDTIQAVVLVFGSLLVTIYGLDALGGWGVLRDTLPQEHFNLWKPLSQPGVPWYYNSNFPWLGMLFCAPIIGLWYWCTDQYIVQRVLGAPNETQARRGAIWASYLKLTPVFIFIIPGMICLALAKSGKLEALAHLAPGGVVDGDAAQAAFPLLVATVLPTYVRGIVVAGLLSALMSSLSSVFNACSTLFTIDIYQKLKPQASQHQLVWMGRVVTGVMVVIGILWIPVIQGSRGLYYYLQSVQGYLAPPIFAVFFLGVFMKRLNARGCLAALIGGFGLGAFRLAVDTFKTIMQPADGSKWEFAEGSFFYVVSNIYFQYFSLLVFLVSVALMLFFSYTSAPPSDDKIRGLTYATTLADDRAKSRASWDWRDVLASVVVVAIILAAYLYFQG